MRSKYSRSDTGSLSRRVCVCVCVCERVVSVRGQRAAGVWGCVSLWGAYFSPVSRRNEPGARA
jgi:hypothetical protein